MNSVRKILTQNQITYHSLPPLVAIASLAIAMRGNKAVTTTLISLEEIITRVGFFGFAIRSLRNACFDLHAVFEGA